MTCRSMILMIGSGFSQEYEKIHPFKFWDDGEDRKQNIDMLLSRLCTYCRVKAKRMSSPVHGTNLQGLVYRLC